MAFLGIGLAAAGAPSGIGEVANILALSSKFAFGRDHEREADIIGLALLAAHKYDIREAPKLWEQSIREEEVNGRESGGSFFFATHPPDGERIATLKKFGNDYLKNNNPGNTGRERFLKKIGPWRASLLRDELKRGRFSTTKELLKMLYEDGFKKGEIKFFEGELYRLRGKTAKKKAERDTDDTGTYIWGENKNHDDKYAKRDDFDIALELYAQAEKDGGAPSELFRSIGLIHHRLNNFREANKSLRHYLDLSPESPDRKVIEFMIRSSS